MFRYLPEQASEIAPRVDFLNNLITDISVFFTVAIVGTMLYFAIKYRKRNGVDHETPRIEGSHLLEVVWTVVPTLILIFMLYYGVTIYRDMRAVPADALKIGVWAQKWKWDFEYSNGKKTNAEFVVPVDTPIQMIMKSHDVLHSFFIPSMRVKRDVLPSEYSYVSFKPVKTGTYQVFCTEYCGMDHWNMLAKMRVVSKGEYEQWLNDRSAELAAARMNPSELGQGLYASKGCNACHSLTGATIVGPSWLKLYGREGEFSDGTKYKADENYIQESIRNPNKHIVKGFSPNLMPMFDSAQLTDEELNGLIAFIRTLDGSKPVEAAAPTAPAAQDLSKLSPAERGKTYYQQKLCSTCHSLDGSRVVGPSFKGIYGRKGKLQGGADYVANDEYIKHSIQKPMDQVVDGYPPAMPALGITDAEVADIIEFMKTVK